MASVPRQYPHLDQIKDPFVAASLRLLWDDHYSVLESQQALAATVAGHTTSLTTLQAGVKTATILAQNAQPAAAKTTAPTGGGTPVGGPAPPSGTDNGQGAAGFLAAFPSGSAPPGSPLTAFTAGQIVGGVATQFHAQYFATPAGSQPILDSWRACFNNRCIFHLNAAGFATSHYPGTGAGSTYLILINIPPSPGVNAQYAYKITNYDPTLTLVAEMTFIAMTPGAGTAPDGGIGDGVVCP